MAIPGMEDYPIKLGTLLFTMVEPEQGREVEYNRWYEHDHFYSGCMVGQWQFAGDRFVATRRLKDAALPRAVRHDARPVDRFVPRDLLGARRPARRVEPVGRRAGHVAARERPHVRGTHAHPHAAVREALGAPRAGRQRAPSSSRSTTTTPVSSSSPVT